MKPIERLTDREFRAATGCSRKEFNEILPAFITAYKDLKYEAYLADPNRKRKPGAGPLGKLDTNEKKLFFILYFLKNYPTFDVLGINFDMSGPKAFDNVYKLYPVLERALTDLGVSPLRKFKSVEDFKTYMEQYEKILIDATTRKIQRPQDKEKQKEYYDGKHKEHTVKNTIISTIDKFILFLGQTVPGRIHDYILLNKEFDKTENWFELLVVLIDLGYLGFAKDYKCKDLQIPHKKPKKSKKNPNPKLTEEQKEENKKISKIRVAVENAIGGFKRYRILVDTFRAKSEELLDSAIFIAAGLWNYKLKYSTK